jgi:PAS domain S-box-containing protein
MTGFAAMILIVDDELPNRRLLEALLQAEGYSTISATNGEEALASVARYAPDLVLLDIMMPGMDGYQVAKILKTNPASTNIPIIMVTAQIDRGARLAGLNAGAEEFLTKPVDRAELWLRVRNLLRLKAYGDLLHNQGAILERQVQERTADLQRFRTAMDATGDAIFLVNRTTMRYVEVNATATRMLGYTRDELLRMGPEQVASVSREQLEREYDALIASRGTGELAQTRFRRKDASEFLVEANRQAQRSGEDWIIVEVMRDITERKEAQKRLPIPDGDARKPLRTLLVVDDEPRVLNALQSMLRQDGYQILTAQSAAEGFELLALHPVEVLLCDERMPTMTGTDFLDKVKDLYPGTFRIVLSGQGDPGVILDAFNRGAIHRYYTKPWDNAVMRKNISEAFQRTGIA